MIKKIKLTRNQHTLVSNEDYEFLNQWKWYALYQQNINGFYANRNVHLCYKNGKQITKSIRMHRLIIEHGLGRELQKNEFIDHINHDPLDNRRENLRLVSNRQNQQNKKQKTTSKYPGVSWHKRNKRWIAQISLNGRNKFLGTFIDEGEAAKAYECACRELVGEELVCKTNGGVV